jgi:hypothetical protein
MRAALERERSKIKRLREALQAIVDCGDARWKERIAILALEHAQLEMLEETRDL